MSNFIFGLPNVFFVIGSHQLGFGISILTIFPVQVQKLKINYFHNFCQNYFSGAMTFIISEMFSYGNPLQSTIKQEDNQNVLNHLGINCFRVLDLNVLVSLIISLKSIPEEAEMKGIIIKMKTHVSYSNCTMSKYINSSKLEL